MFGKATEWFVAMVSFHLPRYSWIDLGFFLLTLYSVSRPHVSIPKGPCVYFAWPLEWICPSWGIIEDPGWVGLTQSTARHTHIETRVRHQNRQP
jgi:hypothetical protein